MIAQLNEKLKNSSFNTDKLKKTIEGLQTQIEEQARRIAELETTIAGKDTLIAEQGAQINALNENVNALTKENEEKAATLEESKPLLKQMAVSPLVRSAEVTQEPYTLINCFLQVAAFFIGCFFRSFCGFQ